MVVVGDCPATPEAIEECEIVDAYLPMGEPVDPCDGCEYAALPNGCAGGSCGAQID